MNNIEKVISCYNKTAAAYAVQFKDELEQKHFDQIMLKAFASENKSKGRMIDLGCGPGQTTRFLRQHGVDDLLGVDLSAEMVKQAQTLNPTIDFEPGNMLQLRYGDNTFGSAVAFYAIVHFNNADLLTAFKEINRVLLPGGEVLLTFHIGEGIIHHETFLGQEVDIDFYMMETDRVVSLSAEAGFETVDVIERRPYPDAEYPSKRTYLWLRKKLS